MSDELNIKNKSKIKTKSSSVSGGGTDIDYVRPAEIPEQELYHGHSFLTKWVFCQDAKVIGVQYTMVAVFTGVVGLILSWMMRMQLGFPELFPFLTAETYYQMVTMHGMIMVVYLLTALFLGGFGNYLIPLMVGARDMVFPYVNMLSFWMFFVAVVVLMASFFCSWWSNRFWLDAISSTSNFRGNSRLRLRYIINAYFFIFIRNWFYNGRIKLHYYNSSSENKEE